MSFNGGYLMQIARAYAPDVARALTKVPVLGPVFTNMAYAYQDTIKKDLNKYGLKYEDLLVEDEDVTHAVDRLSADEFSNRNKRLKRAIDLSLKHKYLKEEVQVALDPFETYLPLDKVRKERIEREILNP